MKKIIALILVLATCFSLVSCLGGGNGGYDYVGEWQVLAYMDSRTNRSIAIREESVLGPTVTIEKERLTYQLNGATVSKETYFSVDERSAVNEFKSYDNRYKKYGSLLPFGESLMLWQGTTDITASVVLLRKGVYEEKFDPISSILVTTDNSLEVKLDALVGEYFSTLAALNMGYNNCHAFSVKANDNSLSVTKDGDTLKFTDKDKTWTVAATAINPYFMGVELKLVSGDQVQYITIMEVSDTAVCYALNSTYSGTELKYDQGSVYNYGVLVKK